MNNIIVEVTNCCIFFNSLVKHILSWINFKFYETIDKIIFEHFYFFVESFYQIVTIRHMICKSTRTFPITDVQYTNIFSKKYVSVQVYNGKKLCKL